MKRRSLWEAYGKAVNVIFTVLICFIVPIASFSPDGSWIGLLVAPIMAYWGWLWLGLPMPDRLLGRSSPQKQNKNRKHRGPHQWNDKTRARRQAAEYLKYGNRFSVNKERLGLLIVKGLRDPEAPYNFDFTDQEWAVEGQLWCGGNYWIKDDRMDHSERASFKVGASLPDPETVPYTYVRCFAPPPNHPNLGNGDWLLATPDGWVPLNPRYRRRKDVLQIKSDQESDDATIGTKFGDIFTWCFVSLCLGLWAFWTIDYLSSL